jgi:steroid Delta-isomerase
VSLVDEHVARFNAGIRTGDWEPMLELFADDARLEFVGIPVGPFEGRDRIRAAYANQPPDDEIVLLPDRRRYAWSREPERPAGEIQLLERDGRIASLRILYETFSA